MTAMTANPKIQFSRLRVIGWSLWDPIGLRGNSDAPADEYDGYLLHVVSLLRSTGSDDDCIRFLEGSEDNRMGLGIRKDTRDRASQTVRAVKEYLASLSSSPT